MSRYKNVILLLIKLFRFDWFMLRLKKNCATEVKISRKLPFLKLGGQILQNFIGIFYSIFSGENVFYEFYPPRANFFDAERNCVARGGHLTDIVDEAEADFLLQEMQNR